MNKPLLGLLLAASTMSATAARADWDHHGRRGEYRGEEHRWGDRREYRGEGQRWGNRRGHYEPRAVQVWVPGVAQQVWEPGRCWRSWGPPRCAPGQYRTVVSAGHYETRTDWVFVAYGGPVGFGLQVGPDAVAVGQY